ncbi:MAG: hypothetical protein IPI10_19115 [Bacteroidetes bacterium]|nr:hypothetical protein [Bacteroidota bacterium]
MIAIDPNNSDIVYVAAYGPLVEWPAVHRGIYKTIDGGKHGRTFYPSAKTQDSTKCIWIHVQQCTYATSHQRRRQVYTYISGGPESNIYKSFDGGANVGHT